MRQASSPEDAKQIGLRLVTKWVVKEENLITIVDNMGINPEVTMSLFNMDSDTLLSLQYLGDELDARRAKSRIDHYLDMQA